MSMMYYDRNGKLKLMPADVPEMVSIDDSNGLDFGCKTYYKLNIETGDIIITSQEILYKINQETT